METTAWPEENWAVLGERIAKARRDRGWDQQELAVRSGNSPNTISNYERGRSTRSRRLPSGVSRVTSALGWPPDAAERILSGEDPDQVTEEPDLFSMAPTADLRRFSGSAKRAPTVNLSPSERELLEAGHVAQDTFMRQVKRFRKYKGVTLQELAALLSGYGEGITQTQLERFENGTLLPRPGDATAIAEALGTTVQWLLRSAFSGDAPDELKGPPTEEELQAEAKAVENRIFDVGAQANEARTRLTQARRAEEDARQQSAHAMNRLQQADSQRLELERQYHYLLGRIDSLRAANGEPLALEVVPVFENDDESLPEGHVYVGRTLERAREAAEMPISELSKRTRIRQGVIRAIEIGDFSVCGEEVFARIGHIRVLARALGLDPQPLIAAFDGVKDSGRSKFAAPEPPSLVGGSRPGPTGRMVRPKRHAGDQ